MPKVKDIARAIEEFAPIEYQESYDNSGLQIGNPDTEIEAALISLDVTEDVVNEAVAKGCDMIVSHHPLLFKGLKHITGATNVERIVEESIRKGVAIYAAHTNLDAASEGINREIGDILGLKNIQPLIPSKSDERVGLGIIGELDKPMPTIEFLRMVKEKFNVKAVRYSAMTPCLVVKKVAACGGAGFEFIENAISQKADVYVTGDIKYHGFTSYGNDILIADIGHYESELCSRQILQRIIHKKFPNFVTYLAETDRNPISIMV